MLESKGDDWGKYYRSAEKGDCFTPSANREIYQEVSEKFLKPVFEKTKLNVLVGGTAGRWSAFDFSEVWSGLRPNNQDSVFFLDMNREPLVKIPSKFFRIQGKLENLPIKDGSIDLIVLDFTLIFLPELSIEKFLKEAKRVLSPQGEGMALVSNLFGRERKKKQLGVSVYIRPLKKYQKMVSEFFPQPATGYFVNETMDEEIGILIFGEQKVA